MNTIINTERWQELLGDYTELRSELDLLSTEIKRKFPRGFTGNGVPGDFEGLEMDWADAERALCDWLASDDGKEFVAIRETMREIVRVKS